MVNCCVATSLYNKAYLQRKLDNRVIRSVSPSNLFLKDVVRPLNEIYDLTTSDTVPELTPGLSRSEPCLFKRVQRERFNRERVKSVSFACIRTWVLQNGETMMFRRNCNTRVNVEFDFNARRIDSFDISLACNDDLICNKMHLQYINREK